jgi:hypothetical protein
LPRATLTSLPFGAQVASNLKSDLKGLSGCQRNPSLPPLPVGRLELIPKCPPLCRPAGILAVGSGYAYPHARRGRHTSIMRVSCERPVPRTEYSVYAPDRPHSRAPARRHGRRPRPIVAGAAHDHDRVVRARRIERRDRARRSRWIERSAPLPDRGRARAMPRSQRAAMDVPVISFRFTVAGYGQFAPVSWD